ncbi:autotransporter assembly complex protein TamA [Rhodovulum sp. DZ06]|uniref:autotransporter assembly complex protein TamA n=1 Tax=Rhodovulum sp. DZ06 TaxID=3425126 RepID=UPI003D325299
MPRLPFAALAVLAAPLLLGACSDREDTAIEELPFTQPESAVAYEATLEDAPNEEVDALARESLRIFRREEDGANSVALLRRRAQQDIEIAGKILRSFGWFEGTAEAVVTAPGEDEKGEPTPAVATLRLIPGPRYTLAGHRFVLIDDGGGPAPAPLDPEILGAPIGAPAAAAEILSAEAAALRQLKAEGRYWAKRRGRRAVADPEAKSIEVETIIAIGPAAVYGETSIEGAPSVSEAHLRTYLSLPPGAPVSQDDLRDQQKAFARTDLFDSVSVRLPDAPPEGAARDETGAVIAPVAVVMEEAEPRTVSAGLRYTADLGPELRLGFIHRNLFNQGERLEMEAIGGTEEQVFETVFRKPQFLRPGQELALGATVYNESVNAFESTGLELAASVRRQLSDRVAVGVGALGEFAQTTQAGVTSDTWIVGAPVFISYDGADDLLDPTTGVRGAAAATPYYSVVDGDGAVLLALDGSVSGYLPLDEEKDFILAGRLRAASILSEALSDIPAQRRLYAGGGGSVRGYAEDLIGPLDADGLPTGGRSAVELGVELRTPLYGALRGAVFVEAGMVGDETYFANGDDLLFAGGLGVRYGSPAGPIRLDVAAPINPRDVDDPFQFYISIGQAW